MKLIIKLILIILIFNNITNLVNSSNNNNNNNNNDYKNKYHSGKSDSYSNSREDDKLDMDSHGFNRFSTNKQYTTLFQQISDRIFYHGDYFSDLSIAITQFGNFIENLKDGGFKNSLKSRKHTITTKETNNNNNNDNSGSNEESGYYTPSPLSSPSSLIKQQQMKMLQQKQQKHNYQSQHQYKTLETPQKPINIEGDSKKPLGQYPIKDGLEDWLKINKPEKLLKEQKENDSKSKHLLHGTNVASACNLGILVKSNNPVNTCQGDKCYINEMNCNGKNISINNLTPYDKSINYDQCQIYSIYCPNSTQEIKIFDFNELYGLNSCQLEQFKCDQTFLSDCPIQKAMCRNTSETSFGTTSFGIDTFAFRCINQELVCNGKVIPPEDYSMYTDAIKNGECNTQQTECSGPSDIIQSLSIKCTGIDGKTNCTLSQSTPSIGLLECMRSVPQQNCECPMDYMGSNCEIETPIICDLNLISPTPNCTGDFILSQQHCFTFALNDSPQFKFLLDCYFAVNNPEPTQSNFNYWIDQPNFKISNPVIWEWKNEYINFYRLFNTNQSINFNLTKDQMSGNEPIIFNSPQLSSIDSQYFIAKRIYAELSLVTPSNQTSITNSGTSSSSNGDTTASFTSTLQRFFIYVPEYPVETHISSSMSKLKLALIIIGSIFGFILLVSAFIYYRNKLKVN